jgi:hypothetical protein
MNQVICSILCSLVGVLDKDSSIDPSIYQQKTFSFTLLLEGAVLFVHIDTCTNEQFVRPGSCYFKDFNMGWAVFVT